DIAPALETRDSVSGGGLAYEGGRLYATSGFGELVALDAASGRGLWRQRVDAPIGGGPAVQNGVVYVLGRNDIGWAVRATDGKVLWQTAGTPST
ncbi:PQQ-like beta-propeller repeat protein, partial [Enterobacter sp. DRP3]|nr:PQQ-like beta-propeller repeat protein [Enterobacter sp. DRP3]